MVFLVGLTHRQSAANQITPANAEERLGFAGKSRVGLSPRPGVAEFIVRPQSQFLEEKRTL